MDKFKSLFSTSAAPYNVHMSPNHIQISLPTQKTTLKSSLTMVTKDLFQEILLCCCVVTKIVCNTDAAYIDLLPLRHISHKAGEAQESDE